MNTKPNILIFLNAFWNNGKGATGGDQMLRQIFKRIRNEFGEVYCYTSSGGKTFLETEVASFKYTLHANLFKGSNLFNIFLIYLLRTLKSISSVNKRKIDILYSGSDFFPDVIPAFLYKVFHPKTKWVQCIFHIYPSCKTRQGNKLANFVAEYMQRFSFYLILKRLDPGTVVCINSQVREELIRLGFHPSQLSVNPPGIDLDYFCQITPDENTPNYDATFLGRLNPSKGIFDLIKIWKEVVKLIPFAKLAIIGGGSASVKIKLEEIIQKEKLSSNIDILGYLENDEAFKIIKKSKVFVFPSHEEGFSIAIAETIACEVPVVAWNLSVYKEVFENHIHAISENNIQEMAEKIIDIINHKEKYADRSSKAKEFITKYNWDTVAKKHLEILRTQYDTKR